MKLYSVCDMRIADKTAIEKYGIPGTTLMKRAAHSLYLALTDHTDPGKKIAVLCGSGNNGGDGYALSLELSKSFENVICLSVFSGMPKTEDARYFYNLCKEKGIQVIDCEKDYSLAENTISEADVIVDAIFGTGFDGEIKPESSAGKLISSSNNSGAYRLSADVPSGASAEFGNVSAITFKADKTVSFAKGKPGLFSYPAREYCGEIEISDIGIPKSVFDMFDNKYQLSSGDLIKELLPKRSPNSNKGSYGRLLIIAGSENMPGAAHLACLGALRCGVGLACLASDKSVISSVSCCLSEPVYLPLENSENDKKMLIEYSKQCSAVLIGCGLGNSETAKERVRALIRSIEAPIVLDADGINAISDNINILSEAKCEIILTPHPKEFSRISGLSVPEIQGNRIKCALDFSEKYNCTLLLKGAGTVIAHKGEKVTINSSGNSALSKGGSGDVLSGMIGSFLAQGISCEDAAICGAYLHGAAGDSLSLELSEYGVMPSEIPERAARIMSQIVE